MSPGEPVQIATDVWWVGTRLENDVFQCHAYFLDNGDQSVLIDPGSPLTIDDTLAKVGQIADLSSIAYLVCHHPDPDIAASLRDLSDVLTRPDVRVVTEWRAQALLKHYGHRFDYYRVEEHEWVVPLDGTRRLEFQLTPYLHFPGAMVSFDTGTRTLFSSDLFGGFVPDSTILVSHDVDYIVESARPFHQHYMPSTQLLSAGLGRIQQRWPDIELIAPQHGHVIPSGVIAAAFEGLKGIDCGIFSLADADLDLQRLLRISEAKSRIGDALLTSADPPSLVTAIDSILAGARAAQDCALFIDLEDRGWTMWAGGLAEPIHRAPDPAWPAVLLPGDPPALLAIHPLDVSQADGDLLEMLRDVAPTVRASIDAFLEKERSARDAAFFETAALTDPLTGAGNRRALLSLSPVGDEALLSIDLDRFKDVNDTFGHPAGDVVLARVTDVMKACIREVDAIYRLGGEEFLVVLTATNEDVALLVAERIRIAVRETDFTGAAPGDRVSVSIGVASVSEGSAAGLAEALEEADVALYRSKGDGRDRVTVFTSLDRR